MRTCFRLVFLCCAFAAALIEAPATSALAQAAASQNATQVFNHGWQFRQVATAQSAEADWLPATVPGDVHLDLLANKKIPDPFYRDNEAKLQWIQNESWEYRLNFDVAPSILARSNVDLVFDGLDAAAQVYLNNTKVLLADNMFRVWRVSAKSRLHAGKNELRVVFPSPVKAAADVAALDPWQPKTKTAPKTYTRKAAYEYGWDWGPTFVTSGIWRPVRLEAWDKVRIADFAIRQRDVSREVAHLNAELQIEAAHDGPARISVQFGNSGKPVTVVETLNLHAGSNNVTVPLEVVGAETMVSSWLR